MFQSTNRIPISSPKKCSKHTSSDIMSHHEISPWYPHIPSGNFLHSFWSHGPVEIVSFPINSMLIFHSFLWIYYHPAKSPWHPFKPPFSYKIYQHMIYLHIESQCWCVFLWFSNFSTVFLWFNHQSPWHPHHHRSKLRFLSEVGHRDLSAAAAAPQGPPASPPLKGVCFSKIYQRYDMTFHYYVMSTFKIVIIIICIYIYVQLWYIYVYIWLWYMIYTHIYIYISIIYYHYMLFSVR